MKTKTNKKAHAFRGAAVLIITALIATALIFTACPNAAKPQEPAQPAPPEYTPVEFIKLNAYLKKLPEGDDTVHKIEVTHLRPENLKGSSTLIQPGPLGKKLQNNATKKVALKLGNDLDITDMSYCFFNCGSLIRVLEVPAAVKDMRCCFSDCRNLKSVTLKCEYNADTIGSYRAFQDAFDKCGKLEVGGIKVPADYYDDYITDAAIKTMFGNDATNTPEKIAAKKKKFAKE